MLRKEITGQKVGVVFGTFAPMHLGHVDLIQRAKRENEAVLVIVSGSNTTCDRGTRAGLHLNRRFRYVREVFADDELVLVDKLDEEHMPAYPEGWSEWTKALAQLISKHVNQQKDLQVTIYMGEADYQEQLEAHAHYFTNMTVKTVLVERSNIAISATDIRQEPLKNWAYITKPFRKHFVKKVLVVGSASGGKTTLVTDLARLYNAPASLEYAREYQQINNIRDDELDVNDYVRLLDGQYSQTGKMIDQGDNVGIVFADTNSSVTKAYYDYYLADSTPEKDNLMIEQLYQHIISREDWDLIFLIPPFTDYVDDGFRDMTMATQDIRDSFTQHLLDLLEPFKEELVILDNGDKDNYYYANYQQAKKAIADRLGITI